MKKRLADNRGFSLVEFLVVVAIMSILIGVMAVSIGRLNSYRAKECKNKIAATLNAVQTTALSKSVGGKDIDVVKASSDGTYVTFFYYPNDKSIYMISTVKGQVSDVQKVGKNDVSVVFDYDGGTARTLSSVSGFISGTGRPRSLSIQTSNLTDIRDAARSVGVNIGFDRESGAYLPSSTDGNLTGISVTKGEYTYNITVHAKTGKIVK